MIQDTYMYILIIIKKLVKNVNNSVNEMLISKNAVNRSLLRFHIHFKLFSVKFGVTHYLNYCELPKKLKKFI